MPATLTLTTRRGEFSLLRVAVPGKGLVDAGVVLYGQDEGYLDFRLRRDWLEVADEDLYEVLSLLQDDLRRKRDELGAEALLGYLEESLSNTVQISPRESVLVGRFPDTLDRLYRQHVAPKVLRYETHLPLQAFSPAAGGFGSESLAEELGWLEMPEDLRLTEEMFVVKVTGRSMEPRIPDGSLCVFRHGVAGSRQGRLVLVADWSASLDGGRYTIKRYRSEKAVSEDGYTHQRIWLEPLNPEFSPLEMTPEAPVAVLAEFLRVLDISAE